MTPNLQQTTNLQQPLDSQQPAKKLFPWYLAHMRSDVKVRTQHQTMTPLSLVDRDNTRIQEMIAQSGQMRIERSFEILRDLRSQSDSKVQTSLKILPLLPGGSEVARTFDKQQIAVSKMMAALQRSADVNVTEPCIDKMADLLIAELEELRQGQRLITDCTSDLLCCLDENRLILELNLEFELTSKYQKLSLLAVPIEGFMPASERQSFIDYLDSCSKGSTAAFESTLQTADGKLVDLEWTAEWSPTSRCFFCRAKNITEKKERQRFKAEVEAMTSHDLRVPITGLGLVLDNIQMGTYGDLSQSGLEKIEQARQSINHMVELIDQLLAAEKLDAGELTSNPSAVCLSDIYARCGMILRSLQEQKNLNIKFPEKSTIIVNADFDHCCRILTNLLSNAISLAPNGSTIAVKETSRTHLQAVVSVIDQGPGIPENVRSTVFARYKSGRPVGGSGLGLYIAKKLTELQGGSIGFATEENKGTTFWFSLPKDMGLPK